MPSTDATSGGTKTPPKADEKKQPDTPKLELDLTRDKATRGDKTSGLGRVLVQLASERVADQIAGHVLQAVGADGGQPHVRVVHDPAALRGADTRDLLLHRARVLQDAVNAVAPPPPASSTEPARRRGIAAPMLTGANMMLQGVGVVSKLLARDYELSGQELAVDGLGFDVRVAQSLMRQDPAPSVTVERLQPTGIAGSDVFTKVAALDQAVHSRLQARVREAAATAAATAAAVASTTAARDHLQAQLIEAIKNTGAGKEVAPLRKVATANATAAAAAQVEWATAHAEHEALRALLDEVTTFLTAAATAPAGGVAPLVEAARSEQAGGYVLYVRLLAGGMDEVVETRAFGSDRWSGLAGVTAEYALMADGVVTAAGTAGALETTSYKLAKPQEAVREAVRHRRNS